MKKTIIIVIIAVLLAGGLGYYAGYNLKPETKCKKECNCASEPDPEPEPDDPNYKEIEDYFVSYLKYDSDLKLNDQNYKIIKVAKTKEEYDEIINSYDLNAGLEEDKLHTFDEKYQYVMLVVEVDGCGEQVIPKKYMVKDNKLLINTELHITCGVCALEQEMFIIAVPADLTFKDVELTFKYISAGECDPDVAYKPVLYLYPEKEEEIDVTFTHPELLTTTYPKYHNGWHVTAKPNGDLLIDNKYYYALYWEEETYNKVDFNEGFYVTKDNAIEFLEDKLTTIGLTPREQNEFIMYWLPILEKNEQSLVYFELTDELQKSNALNITPTPDSLLRIRIHIKKVDNKINIKEQTLPTFTRSGFTAVEWGGVIY